MPTSLLCIGNLGIRSSLIKYRCLPRRILPSRRRNSNDPRERILCKKKDTKSGRNQAAKVEPQILKILTGILIDFSSLFHLNFAPNPPPNYQQSQNVVCMYRGFFVNDVYIFHACLLSSTHAPTIFSATSNFVTALLVSN